MLRIDLLPLLCYNTDMVVMSVKLKKYVFGPIIILLCIILHVFFAKPAIEKRTWVLSYAQQTEPPLSVVAHNDKYDLSNIDSSLFAFSKPIEFTLEAKDGKLILTDITNGNSYEGTYTIKTFGRYITQNYSVVINEIEGTANIGSKSGRILFVFIGDYCLCFEANKKTFGF